MKKIGTSDINKVREAIELFAVHYFETIEMSGTVNAQKKDDINYFSIDLTNVKWDENIPKLHQSLSKYINEWGQKNISNFIDYISISRLTLEYVLPEKDGANQNQSRHLKLFYLPSYYYRASQKDGKTYSKFVLGILIYWHNIFIRNAIITILATTIMILISLYMTNSNPEFRDRLVKSYDYINIASGIIASFVLGFLINKAITIRQDKLKYTKTIRNLSNKLTYFRNICFNLVRDHNFWRREEPFHESYEYANSIKHDITFEDYYYPDYDDAIKYAKYKSFYKENMWHSVVSLMLQLQMMADESFLDSGFTYTAFPLNYVYSHEEMERFIIFSDSNLIWYCSSETKIFPKTFYKSYRIQQIIEDINRIYPKGKIEELTSDKLEQVSLDFQYKIIPRLFKLTKLVDSGLPLTVKYFVWTFTLLLSFGIIVPTLTYIFIDQVYAFMSVFLVIGIIVHILLTLKPILEAENTLDKKNDYL
jgi:hypothetical protein